MSFLFEYTRTRSVSFLAHLFSLTSARRTLMTRCFILLTSLLLLPSLASAQDRNETSKYKVSWRDNQVAQVTLRQGCPTEKHTPTALRASSTGMAKELHSFSIRLDSFTSLRSALPLQGRTRITEEGRTRSYISDFSDSTIKVRSSIFGKKKEHSLSSPVPAHDLLSWVIALQDEVADEDFKSKTFTVWDGWKLVEIKASRQPSERISTPLKTYTDAHTLSLERTRISEDGTAKDSPSSLGKLWFSADARPKLVAMDFESKVGEAHIRLVKHTSKQCKVPKKGA